MASPPKPVRYKCLSTIKLGGNELRFIGVNERNNAAHFPHTVTDCAGRLLFVGTDVMCGSAISKKNFIRVHTRFAKLGLATKMRLSAFKIEGINNSGTVWFYSVQGLFRVAFDLGNLVFQRDCLTMLQEVWLKRYDDPLLPAEGVLRFNRRLRVSPQHCELIEVRLPHQCEREEEARRSIGGSCSSRCILFSDGVKNYVDMEIDDKNTESTCECDTVPCDCDPLSVTEETVRSGNCQRNAGSDLTETRLQCDDHDNKEDSGEQEYKSFGTDEFREKLFKFIQTSFIEEMSSVVVRQILLVLEYINYFASLEDNESFENFGCGFFKMMEEFLVLVDVDSQYTQMFQNTFGMPREKYILLYLISDWLGHEYHELESRIMEKMDTFKQKHIISIDTLPSAETVVSTLFPSCMKTFVINWQGVGKVVTEPCTFSTGSDHCYIRQPKTMRHAGNINYSLVQLVLEFGSNCLLSGLSHVVFSRLQVENRSSAFRASFIREDGDTSVTAST